MDKLMDGIRAALIETDRAIDKDIIKMLGYQIMDRSDWATIYVDIYQPRKKKPLGGWRLAVNIVKNQIHWDKSAYTIYR